MFGSLNAASGCLRRLPDRHLRCDVSASSPTWQRERPKFIAEIALPNISPEKSDGTSDAAVETEDAMTSINEWYQFVRVWYRE